MRTNFDFHEKIKNWNVPPNGQKVAVYYVVLNPGPVSLAGNFCPSFQINIVENGGDRRDAPRVVDPEGKHKARKIDKVSRKLFPIAFVLFNIVYWIMYTLPISTSMEWCQTDFVFWMLCSLCLYLHLEMKIQITAYYEHKVLNRRVAMTAWSLLVRSKWLSRWCHGYVKLDPVQSCRLTFYTHGTKNVLKKKTRKIKR